VQREKRFYHLNCNHMLRAAKAIICPVRDKFALYMKYALVGISSMEVGRAVILAHVAMS
jgi:hypothetical protein